MSQQPISARLIFIVALSSMAVAVVGFVLVVFGHEFGRIFVFVAVPIGGLAVFVGSIGAFAGLVKNDLRK